MVHTERRQTQRLPRGGGGLQAHQISLLEGRVAVFAFPLHLLSWLRVVVVFVAVLFFFVGAFVLTVVLVRGLLTTPLSRSGGAWLRRVVVRVDVDDVVFMPPRGSIRLALR